MADEGFKRKLAAILSADYKNPAHLEEVLDTQRKAGIPEHAPSQ
jgi:hypothetical protein